MDYIHNHQTILKGGTTAIFTASLLIRLAENPNLFEDAYPEILEMFKNEDVDKLAGINIAMACMAVEGNYDSVEEVIKPFSDHRDRYPNIFLILAKDIDLGLRIKIAREINANHELTALANALKFSNKSNTVN